MTQVEISVRRTTSKLYARGADGLGFGISFLIEEQDNAQRAMKQTSSGIKIRLNPA